MIGKYCDVCGKKHFNMRIDRRLKEMFNIEAHICLDCDAWFDDNDRYDMLLENGLINDEMFDKLVIGK